MLGRRADGTQVRDLSTLRRFMPFISPRRNESLVYFDSEIEVDAALRFLEERNATRPADRRMTLFHLFLRSLSQQFHERPHVNRFTKGGRLWQRHGVWVTFSAKQEIVDGAKLLTVKREFPRDESLDAMTDAVLDRLQRRRGGEEAFAMLGRVRERADGSHVMPVRYTYDERIEDGLYAGITLTAVKDGVEHPEKLL